MVTTLGSHEGRANMEAHENFPGYYTVLFLGSGRNGIYFFIVLKLNMYIFKESLVHMPYFQIDKKKHIMKK